MKIVFGGYIIGYPLGGMTWHHLNYLLGLHALGHEVTFLEDSGTWGRPYNPRTWACEDDPTYGIDYLRATFRQYGLPERWCYYSEPLNQYFGMSGEALDDVLRGADLLICVSGVTPLRPERPRPRRCLVVDTDPVFTQLKMREDATFRDYFERFDRVATFGSLIGTPACPLPTFGIDWIPTRQPISLPHWPARPIPSDGAFGTLGKWEHSVERHVEFDGRRYLSSKGVEWVKLLDLPGRVGDGTRFDLGMTSLDDAARRSFESHGWHFFDAEATSASPQSYADYIAAARGELTVVKQIYNGLPSGWFSDRSACFLATGRPVITQSAGFEHWLPPGEGLLTFASVDEAAAAVRAVNADPARHGRAARALAEAHLDARRVLADLIDRAM